MDIIGSSQHPPNTINQHTRIYSFKFPLSFSALSQTKHICGMACQTRCRKQPIPMHTAERALRVSKSACAAHFGNELGCKMHLPLHFLVARVEKSCRCDEPRTHAEHDISPDPLIRRRAFACERVALKLKPGARKKITQSMRREMFCLLAVVLAGN